LPFEPNNKSFLAEQLSKKKINIDTEEDSIPPTMFDERHHKEGEVTHHQNVHPLPPNKLSLFAAIITHHHPSPMIISGVVPKDSVIPGQFPVSYPARRLPDAQRSLCLLVKIHSCGNVSQLAELLGIIAVGVGEPPFYSHCMCAAQHCQQQSTLLLLLNSKRAVG